MPDTLTRERRGAAASAALAARAALAKVIANVQQQEAELAKLRAAQDRTHDKWHEDSQALHSADSILADAQERESKRALRAFVEGAPDTSPLPQAEAAVVEAREKLDATRVLETALEAEVEHAEGALRFQRSLLDQRIASCLPPAQNW